MIQIQIPVDQKFYVLSLRLAVRLMYGIRNAGDWLEIWIGGSLMSGEEKEFYSQSEPGMFTNDR